MGANYGRSKESSPEEEIQIIPNNGFIFNEFFLPPEVVTHILGFLEPTLNGRLVCKSWHDIIDTAIWHEKVMREVPGATEELFRSKDLVWQDFHLLCAKKPHKKNLLRNGSGDEKFAYWSNMGDKRRYSGGTNWIIESQPVGCDPFPEGIKHVFSTSYDWCSAEQVIILQESGLTPNFMKNVCPDIHIEEWYTGRFDCGFEYTLKVSLLNHSWEIIDSFVFKTSGHTTNWAKVEHVFSDYGGEVTMILFHHKGKDNQFWAGHYGVKLTGAKVYVTLPGWEEKEPE